MLLNKTFPFCGLLRLQKLSEKEPGFRSEVERWRQKSEGITRYGSELSSPVSDEVNPFAWQ